MNGKDYYKTLGIERKASAKEIKQAYLKLARKHHPDLNPGDKKAEEQFKAIQEAYDVLSDPEKKAKYDQFGEMWQQAPFGGAPGAGNNPYGATVDFGAGVGVEDFLEQVLGGMGRGGRQRPGNFRFTERSAAPAEDLEFSLDITLEEAYRGTVKRIQVQVEDVCPECEGLGQKRNNRGQIDLTTCPRCRGRGRIPAQRGGQVTVPAGAWDGFRLKVTGEGASDARGRRGDLYVQVHILPKPGYERNGQDLTFDIAVPYTVAALGGEVKVATLDGQQRDLIVPAGIQTGQKMRLAGQGMPAMRERQVGDAYARVKITVPKNLSDQERSLLQQLAHLRNDPIRSGG